MRAVAQFPQARFSAAVMFCKPRLSKRPSGGKRGQRHFLEWVYVALLSVREHELLYLGHAPLALPHGESSASPLFLWDLLACSF